MWDIDLRSNIEVREINCSDCLKIKKSDRKNAAKLWLISFLRWKSSATELIKSKSIQTFKEEAVAQCKFQCHIKVLHADTEKCRKANVTNWAILLYFRVTQNDCKRFQGIAHTHTVLALSKNIYQKKAGRTRISMQSNLITTKYKL